jgi:hypothetical protein
MGCATLPNFQKSIDIKATLCSQQPIARGQYIPKKGTYKLTDIIWTYIELYNLKLREDDKGTHVWIDCIAEVINAKNEVMYTSEFKDRKFYLSQEQYDEDFFLYYVLAPFHPDISLEAGKYSIIFIIWDNYTEKKDTQKLDFEIERFFNT